MSKQSVEQVLKDIIEASNAKTVALTEQLQKLAAGNSNYTERLQKMEENLTSAMQKVLEMDSNIKDFHKAFGSKVDDMEKKFASWWKQNEDEMEKPDNWDEMTEEQQQEWIDENAKTEVAKMAKKAENMIDGVNPKVVTGQPNPTEKKDDEEDEMEVAKEDSYRAKKGKAAKKAGELEVSIEHESEEEEGEEEGETAKKVVIKGKAKKEEAYDEDEPVKFPAPNDHNAKGKKGKKALEKDIVKPDTHEVTAEPLDETATEQVENVENKLGKKATHNVPEIHKGEPVDSTEELNDDAKKKQEELVKPLGKKAKKASLEDGEKMEDGENIGNDEPVNKKYDEEKADEACNYEEPKSKKGKKADESEAPVAEAVEQKPEVVASESTPTPVADVAKLVESVSGKIEAAYEKLAAATMKQASAETKATAVEAEIAALKAKAEQESAEKVAALEAAKTLALEVKAQTEAAAAVKALEAKLAEMTQKLAALETADKSAEMKAAKIVASTGISEGVAAAPVVSAEQSDDEVFAQFEKLQGKEQRAYYVANKQVIERVAFRNTKNRFR